LKTLSLKEKMLLNVSYNNPEIRKKIDTTLGKPIPLRERLKMRDIGLGHLIITDSSIHIHNLLILDSNRNLWIEQKNILYIMINII